MPKDISEIFLIFMMYSSLGWIMEVLVTLYKNKKIINRGFLIGPYCPIYGWGCMMIIFLLDKYKSNIFILFIMAIIICSILEYYTSYFMEKIFKTRWWDYSKNKYNINGRICIETMIPFGILGCIVIYIINPIFKNILSKTPLSIINALALSLFIIFLVDNIISISIIFKLRNTISKYEKDATEEITKKVREIFINNGILQRRLIKAFPTMKSYKEKLIEIKERIDRKLEDMKK